MGSLLGYARLPTDALAAAGCFLTVGTQALDVAQRHTAAAATGGTPPPLI